MFCTSDMKVQVRRNSTRKQWCGKWCQKRRSMRITSSPNASRQITVLTTRKQNSKARRQCKHHDTHQKLHTHHRSRSSSTLHRISTAFAFFLSKQQTTQYLSLTIVKQQTTQRNQNEARHRLPPFGSCRRFRPWRKDCPLHCPPNELHRNRD